MQTWVQLMLGGVACMVVGAVLLFGFDRNWFSIVYTSTIEGGEGVAVIGVMLAVIGAIVVIAGIIIAI